MAVGEAGLVAVGRGWTVEERAGAGTAPAELVELCRVEHPRLVGALGLYTGQRELAEELAQEALLRLCQHWERVSQMESPGGWLHRVAMNLAASAQRRRRTASAAVPQLEHEQRASLLARQQRPTDTAIVVRQAVSALPEQMREIVVYRFYLDLSVREVAALTGRPEGTVKAMTSRAVAKLRTLGLEGLFEEPEDA